MKHYLLFLISFLIVLVAKFLPFSFIIGSQFAFFSGTTSICLLMARHTGLGIILLFLLPLKVLSISQLFLFLIHRVPLLFAAWSYRVSNFFTSMVLPIICLVLFLIHPVGQQAWSYPLYWFIPMMIYVAGYNNIFLKALESVFVAHAVGSVIWLYTHDMSSDIWLGLIPLVPVERLLMALGIVAGEQLILFCKILYSKIKLFYYGKIA